MQSIASTSMPIHLPDAHKYHPVSEEEVITVVKTHDFDKRLDYLEIQTGTNEGIDPTYWKDGYRIRHTSGRRALCCPGLLYPRTLAASDVWSHIADRLSGYVFLTPANWRPPSDADNIDGDPEFQISSHRTVVSKLNEKSVKVEEEHGIGASQEERCIICADRRKYWAVSPPVFLSKNSRRWHVHADCLQHLLPRRQFGLKSLQAVDFH